LGLGLMITSFISKGGSWPAKMTKIMI
jgi:hypothetical protein